MITRKAMRWDIVLRYSYKNILYSVFTATLAYLLFRFSDIDHYEVPGFIITTMGTALAIFLGFRNSSAYDRWWEARKIWGGIVNYSRSWARSVRVLIDAPENDPADDPQPLHHELLYGQLAWINALRLQLRRQQEEADWQEGVAPFLAEDDYLRLRRYPNAATQLLKWQSEHVDRALKEGRLDRFGRLQLEEILNELYNLQGRSERIKNTPMGKYYDFFTLVFLQAFILILPFGILSAFTLNNIPEVVFPLTIIVGWVFYIIFLVGSAKEHPFENNPFDVPLTAICRTIEIDLRAMLGEQDLPQPVQPENGILY